jgi:hypothetical protein
MECQVPVVARGRLTTVSAGPTGKSGTKKVAARSRRGKAQRERALSSTNEAGVAALAGLPEPIALARELNHRVKNNLQIIVSLMNLRKRMIPPDRHGDIRFIEEHVQSMSVAYRLAYATGTMIEVSVTELVTEVLSGLRQIAGLEEEYVCLEALSADAMIALDAAAALALYLAVSLPPWLDQAVATGGAVTVTFGVVAEQLTLSVRGDRTGSIGADPLRARLMRAYAAQLKAEILSAATYGTEQLRFMLERTAAAGN